ncbi:MAG: alpha/beta hydrolase, partial [Opitutaceae bacterium]|nr:alpha/beta hydrolase [Verrucomicrobiales bacterium]
MLLSTGCITHIPDGVRAVKNIEYAQPGGHSLKLDLYLPEKPVGKLPIIVWIHGGSWKSGSKDFCPIAFMAQKGLAIVSLNYRLSTVAAYPAQLHDCKGTLRWLRAHAAEYQLDPDRIGIFGASAGGHLAALLATTGDAKDLEGDVGGNLEFSSRVEAVCAFYPPTDLNKLVTNPKWRKSPDSDVGRLLGGPIEENLDKAATANPINYITPKTAPIFLLHGDQDTLVPISQSEILYQALQKAGVESEFAIVKGKGHGIIAPPDV